MSGGDFKKKKKKQQEFINAVVSGGCTYKEKYVFDERLSKRIVHWCY